MFILNLEFDSMIGSFKMQYIANFVCYGCWLVDINLAFNDLC